MTDQQIDFELALAIGYAPDRVRNRFYSSNDLRHFVQVLNDYSRCDGPMNYDGWQRFDHKDPAVIWPIAERLNCFPVDGFFGIERWYIHRRLQGGAIVITKSHNPATATALAVIKHFESKA